MSFFFFDFFSFWAPDLAQHFHDYEALDLRFANCAYFHMTDNSTIKPILTSSTVRGNTTRLWGDRKLRKTLITIIFQSHKSVQLDLPQWRLVAFSYVSEVNFAESYSIIRSSKHDSSFVWSVLRGENFFTLWRHWTANY